MNVAAETYIVGTCMHMCSASEIKMRENNKLLHPLEICKGINKHGRPRADWQLMVKEFTRPAAGKVEPNASELRPAPVLLSTVRFLVNQVLMRKDYPWSFLYEYVFDRLRAVRQDMVIQNIEGQDAIQILQIAVRFYIYAGYRLCTEPVLTFDPHINSSHAQECLKRLLTLYESTPQVCPHHRAEFESLYIVFNLGSEEALQHGLKLRQNFRNCEVFMTSLQVNIAQMTRNYVRTIRLVSRLPSMHLCAFHRHLDNINRQTLEVMSHAYHSKSLTFPLSRLRSLLQTDDETAARQMCAQYGLNVSQDKVQFIKTHFKTDFKIKPSHRSFIEHVINRGQLNQLICGAEDYFPHYFLRLTNHDRNV